VSAVPADNTPNTTRTEESDAPVNDVGARSEDDYSGCNRKQWVILSAILIFLALAGLAVGLVFAFVLDDGKPSADSSQVEAPGTGPVITTTTVSTESTTLTVQETRTPFSGTTTIQATPEPATSPVIEPTFFTTSSPTPLPPTTFIMPGPTVMSSEPPISVSSSPITLPPSTFTTPRPTVMSSEPPASVTSLLTTLLPTTFLMPGPTFASSEPPVSVPQDLIDLLSFHSYDAGAALRMEDTPQNKALKWLAGNANLDLYSNEQKIQWYTLAMLYYSTGGESWDTLGLWLTDSNECGGWGNAMSCKTGTVLELEMNIVLDGTIPNEIALLSSLGELVSYAL